MGYQPPLEVRQVAGRVRLLLGTLTYGEGATLQEAADDLVAGVLALVMAFRLGSRQAVEQQIKNLVLWTRRGQECDLLPDARSGDGGPKLRPHCDQATHDAQGTHARIGPTRWPLTRSNGDAKERGGWAGMGDG
jgi:hypothetical protein